MKSPLSTTVLIIAWGLLGSAAQAGAGSLDGSSIKGLFPGYFEARVQGYTIYFAGTRNGSLKGQSYGRQDRGTWFVKGNSLCVAWKEWTKGKAKCGSIAQKGGWFVASNGEGEMLKFRRAMVAQQ